MGRLERVNGGGGSRTSVIHSIIKVFLNQLIKDIIYNTNKNIQYLGLI